MKIHYFNSLITLCILIFSSGFSYAQNQEDWTNLRATTIRLCPNTVLKDTTVFSYSYSEEGFDLNDITPKLKQNHCITTKNHDFCSFILNQPILTVDDSIMLIKWGDACRIQDFARNEGYLIHVENDLKNLLDHSTPLKAVLKKVSTKLTKEIIQAFNADQGFSYPIQLKKGSLKKFYAYCQVIVISKKEAGFLMFYCLYNDEGKKHLKQYQQDLARLIGFTDELYVVPPMPDNIIIRAGSPKKDL